MADPGGGRLVGETISHYRVIALLGAGGMGVVYRGEDLRLGRPVAIKFVADDFANDAQAVARLRAEARAASGLNHPNICTIYDIGTHEDHPFIVMELMEGMTLRDRLARGHLKVYKLVDLGIEVADALQAAHTATIMHRDIKPANVFLTNHGHVKLLDFGLAKTTIASRQGPDSTTLNSKDLTAAGTTLGTVSYMSPEQATGDELDGRTDLFSLGVVLYECATGRRPFEGKTHAVILSGILNRAPAPPTLLNQDLPVRLQEIILTCLEKDRELRYQNAADLRADLKRVRRDLESGRMHLGDTATLQTGTGTSPESATAGVPRSGTSTADATMPDRSRRPLVAAGAIAAAVIVAGGGYALWHRQQPTAVPVSTSPPPGDAPAAAPAAADGIQSRLQLARAALAAGNYRAAQAYTVEILASDPKNGEALSIRQQSTAALERFDQALALARQRLAADDVQAAARALTDAREIDPTSPAVIELSAALARRVRDSQLSASAQGRRARGGDTAAEPTNPATPAPARGADAAAAAPLPSPAAASPAQASAAPPPPVAPSTPPAAVPPVPPATADSSAATVRPAERPAPAPPPAPSPDRSAPAAPSRPSASDDETAVRRVVASYARAIENKDVSLFRSVKPNLSREEERRLQDGFRAVVSQQVQITPLSIDIHDQEATLTGQRRDVIDAGGRRQTVESRQTFRLARTATGWVITEIR